MSLTETYSFKKERVDVLVFKLITKIPQEMHLFPLNLMLPKITYHDLIFNFVLV